MKMAEIRCDKCGKVAIFLAHGSRIAAGISVTCEKCRQRDSIIPDFLREMGKYKND